jgi:hypothetical protein
MRRFILIIITIVLLISSTSCYSKLKATLNTQKNNLEETIVQKDKEMATLKSKLDIALNDQEQVEEIIYTLKNEADKDNLTQVKKLINVLKDKIDKQNITFYDQRQVEQLIKDYFAFLEKKDYASAWELRSTELKTIGSKEDMIKTHLGVESINFVSMKGYIPPKKIGAGESATFQPMKEVPTNTPTVCFMVELNIEPSPDTAWGKGLNTCFVDVIKDGDGKWRINGLSTGP